MASLTTIRDRVQIYNARVRQKNDSNVDEYLTILKTLEKSSTNVARLSMNRNEALVLLLSQPHMIQEVKRCYVNPSNEASPSVLCNFLSFIFKRDLCRSVGIDTTFNFGRFFVTPITFRNTALQYRKTKKTPVFIGPTMIYYRNDVQSYQELLDYIRREVDSTAIVIGSDGDKALHKALQNVFPGSTHLQRCP